MFRSAKAVPLLSILILVSSAFAWASVQAPAPPSPAVDSKSETVAPAPPEDAPRQGCRRHGSTATAARGNCPHRSEAGSGGTRCGKGGQGRGAEHGQGAMRRGDGQGQGPGHRRGVGSQGGRGQGMRHGAGASRGPAGAPDHRQSIHALLSSHQKIERKVEEIPNGVRTVTTSADPEVAATIRKHAREMKARVESGEPIRMFDPLFQEIFRHHQAIAMEVEDVPGGVKVTETSKDPQVTALIRQHAKVVSEFAAEGMSRAHEPSPLPEGYSAK